MNIGIICYPTYGWSGVVATELWMVLASLGHQVHFISYRKPVRLDTHKDNIHYHEVHISEYPLFEYQPYELELTSRIVHIAIQHKLEILHVHYAIPHASAAYMAQQILAQKWIPLPYITTLHGTDITLIGKEPWFKPVISFVTESSSAVTSVSQSLKNDTIVNFDLKSSIQVIPNFINMLEYEDLEESELLKKQIAPHWEYILSHTSNFRPVKRIKDVIEIFDKVQKKHSVKLVLIGDWPERKPIEKLVEKKKLTNKVDFLWKLKDIKKVLAVSDIFLLTSEAESFWLAWLEAMAAKNAIVSSNAGGITEVNKDWETWFVHEIWDVSHMAVSVETLLSLPKKLEQYKRQAFERAKLYDKSKIIPQYISLYENVLQNSSL